MSRHEAMSCVARREVAKGESGKDGEIGSKESVKVCSRWVRYGQADRNAGR